MTNKEYLLRLWGANTDILADDIMDFDVNERGYWHFAVGEENMILSGDYIAAHAAQVAWLESEHVKMEF